MAGKHEAGIDDDGGVSAGDADSGAAARLAVEKRHDERRSKIAIIAYYKAQRRGFATSGELDDWLSAEREVDAAAANEKPA